MSWIEILKGEWRPIVDKTFRDGIHLQEIMDAISKQMGLRSPKVEEVVSYLNQNYNKHPVWSNVYVEGEE
tara:strand:- start:2380 stop:2589 length:210 start_codon:yes stop_codon:yes gene_type:complete